MPKREISVNSSYFTTNTMYLSLTNLTLIAEPPPSVCHIVNNVKRAYNHSGIVNRFSSRRGSREAPAVGIFHNLVLTESKNRMLKKNFLPLDMFIPLEFRDFSFLPVRLVHFVHLLRKCARVFCVREKKYVHEYYSPSF